MRTVNNVNKNNYFFIEQYFSKKIMDSDFKLWLFGVAIVDFKILFWLFTSSYEKWVFRSHVITRLAQNVCQIQISGSQNLNFQMEQDAYRRLGDYSIYNHNDNE